MLGLVPVIHVDPRDKPGRDEEKEQPLLKFGYKASAEQFGPRELLEFSCLAEDVGFDSVFVSDHFQPWKHTGGHATFSFAWLAALGAKTRRVQIGTSVATPTFRYHPSVVAQAFGTLGVMCPDRVVLGVGTGESLNEVAGLQGAAGPPARVDRLDPAAVDRGARHVRRPVLPHPGGDDLRPPGKAGADLDRRIGPDCGGHGW